jgi:2,5-diamino-6-(ribosylamino)-4(3H)-pyrimidinone 5'-phosphate reductase
MPRPWVSTNLAISADGKISSVRKIPSGWTSKEDHARFLEIRKAADALLVGRGTLEADHMTMTAPGNPLRCIISKSGDLDPKHPLFSTPGGPIHLLITGGDMPSLPAEIPPKVTVHLTRLGDFLEDLAEKHHVERLHCEGGGQLIQALAEIDAIDEFHLTLAGHTLFGGQKAPTATGIPGDFLPRSTDFKISHFDPRPDLGECFLSYIRRR